MRAAAFRASTALIDLGDKLQPAVDANLLLSIREEADPAQPRLIVTEPGEGYRLIA
ncbi:hypothetical protein D3C86_1481340 [compost metagenome]